MKKLILICSVLLLTISQKSVIAQDSIEYGNATLSAPACIVLDTTTPTLVNYKMDLTVLGFTTEDEAKNWAGHYSNNIITLSTNFSLGEAYIRIHPEYLLDAKDMTWWNAYLADLCTYYIEN